MRYHEPSDTYACVNWDCVHSQGYKPPLPPFLNQQWNVILKKDLVPAGQVYFFGDPFRSQQPVDIHQRIRDLDVTLFDGIESQSLSQDKRAWLAIQRSIRHPGYRYLEIGSHLGGSIQQHVLDPNCLSVVSIDPRPASQPDDRGDGKQVFHYENNSTVRMLENLAKVGGTKAQKVICLEFSTPQLTEDKIIGIGTPDFCLIDGEHTHRAAMQDFQFCLRVCSHNGVIAFHDSNILRKTIDTAVEALMMLMVPFALADFPGIVSAFFLGDCKAKEDPFIKPYILGSHG